MELRDIRVAKAMESRTYHAHTALGLAGMCKALELSTSRYLIERAEKTEGTRGQKGKG